MDLLAFVGERIRQLRDNFGGGPISQETLADGIGVSTNTISRWETATYRPSLEDLDKLSKFFGVSILTFFPSEEEAQTKQVQALLRTARQLDAADLEELKRYAEFRRARALLEKDRKSIRTRRRNG